MIMPSKYMDLDASVLNVASIILEYLLIGSAATVDELRATVEQRIGDRARHGFLPALNLLFLFGSIEYDEGADAILRVAQAT